VALTYECNATTVALQLTVCFVYAVLSCTDSFTHSDTLLNVTAVLCTNVDHFKLRTDTVAVLLTYSVLLIAALLVVPVRVSVSGHANARATKQKSNKTATYITALRCSVVTKV
jgi:hypothetical protein